MPRSRPDYIQRRIELQLQRRSHLRVAPADCPCPTCAPRDALRERLEAKLAAQREQSGAPPF